MSTFYVYEHIRPDTGAVFYVGKGSGKRAGILFSRPNRYHKNITALLRKAGLRPEVRFVAENIPEESAFCLERMRIAMWRAAGVKIANQTDGGEGQSNPTSEVRAKMRAAKVGKPLSPEHCAKLAAATAAREPVRGWNHTDEARQKISDGLVGRCVSEATREKIRAANTGKVHSEETRQKLRAIKTGFKHTEEARAKISAAGVGRIWSDEKRAKLSATKTGTTHTPETCAKLSAIASQRTIIRDDKGRIIGVKKNAA